MNKPSQVQSGTIAPVVLTVSPAALVTELNAILPPDQIGYSSGKHIELVTRLQSHLKDKDGNPAQINAALQTIFRVIFRPTEDDLRDLLKQGLREAGYVLDEDTEKMFVMMFSAPQFADFLAKNKNPQTGKPFITKEKKRGVKNNTFASLISASSAPKPTSLPVEPVVPPTPPQAARSGKDAAPIEAEIVSITPVSEQTASSTPTTEK